MRSPDIEIQAFLDGEATAHWMFCSQFLSDSFYEALDWKVEYSKERYLEVLDGFEKIYLRRTRDETKEPDRIII